MQLGSCPQKHSLTAFKWDYFRFCVKLKTMTTHSDYTEFLITAIDEVSADTFAANNSFVEGSWFRLPSTLADAPEAFKKESTAILSKADWAELSEEEYAAQSLTGNADDRILFAQDFHAAARYASKRNWWLHSWKFVEDADLEEVVEYGFYCC